MDLMRKTASGAIVMGVTNVGSQAALLAVTFVMARILTPREFGLVAMVVPILALVWLVQELGTSAATIQKRVLTPAETSIAFWLNVGMAAIAWALLTGASSLIARLYQEPVLTGMVMAMASVVLLSGLGAQPRAILVRAMRFRTLAAIEIGGVVASGVLGIGCGLYGLKVWALVVMQLTGPAIRTVAYWIATGFRPGWPRWVPTAAGIVRFGGELTVFRLLDYCVRNLDVILMGRVWGAAATGFYSRALNLALNPLTCANAPLNAVALPALARLQDEPSRLGEAYLRMARGMTAITFPTACCLFVLAPEVVSLALGDQWGPAIPIFRIMCIVALFEAAQRCIEWVFLATGHTGSYLRWGLVSVPIVCTAYLLGLPWGGVGVATGFAVSRSLLYLPGVWWALRLTHRRPTDVVTYLGPTLLASVAAAAGGWCVLRLALPAGAAAGLRAVVTGGTALMLYVGLMAALAPGSVADLRDVVRRLAQRSSEAEACGAGAAGDAPLPADSEPEEAGDAGSGSA